MTVINRPCDVRITKKFSFDGAHNLPNHPGKCKNLHGHSWKLEVTLAGKIDPDTGMIMDFSDLKNIVNENVIKVLDHSHLNTTLENPTAENLLVWIWERLEGLLKNGGTNLLHKLRLYESEDSYAEICATDMYELKKREELGQNRRQVRPSIN